MLAYVIFLFILLIMGLISITEPFGSKKNNIIILVLLLVFVFTLFAFRYNVGADYVAYNVIYNIDDASNINSWEIGFQKLFRLFQSLDLSFQIFSGFILFINILSLFIMLNKDNKYVVLGAVIYFLSADGFFASISFYRQSISVSFFMISMLFLFDLKWKRYIILNSVGALFHTSNLVALPVVLVGLIRVNNKVALILPPVLIYFIAQSGALEGGVSSVLNLLGFYLEYIKTDAFSGESGMGLGYLLQLFLFVVLISTSNLNTGEQYKVMTIYSLYLCLTAASINMLLFYRLAVVFSPIQAIAIPMLISCSKVKQKKLLVLSVMLFYIVLFLRNFSSPIYLRDFTPFQFVGIL